MNGIWGLVFFVAILALQGVVAAVRKAAKAKQEEQLRQEAEARRRVGRLGAATPAGGSGGAIRSPAPRTAPGLDEIAMRRKAQLDELRRRRNVRGDAPAEVRVGPGPKVTAPLGRGSQPAKERPEIKTVEAGFKALRKAEEKDRQVREGRVGREVVAREAQAQESRRDAERTREAAPRVLEKLAVERAAHAAKEIAGAEAKVAGARPARLARVLRSPSALRDLFIVKELLDPPVGLR